MKSTGQPGVLRRFAPPANGYGAIVMGLHSMPLKFLNFRGIFLLSGKELLSLPGDNFLGGHPLGSQLIGRCFHIRPANGETKNQPFGLGNV